jgi:hypothetical protein
VDVFQISCGAVGKKESSATKRVAHALTDSQKPNNKILPDVGSRRERKIKAPRVKELNGSQKFDPQQRKGVVLSPAGVVLRPWDSHRDHFIYYILVFEERSALGACQENDAGIGIVNPEILQKR